ncbi:MAG: HNH endonuclease, partial [bacterium]
MISLILKPFALIAIDSRLINKKIICGIYTRITMAHKRYQTSYYQRVRKEVLARDYYTCHYCGMEANTVDHLIPLSKNGTDEASNMVAACTKCNSSKR